MQKKLLFCLGVVSCIYAKEVSVSSIDSLLISGDIELKQIKDKNSTATIDKRTAEINLHFDAKTKNGLKIHTTFTAYDDTQADANASNDVKTKEAYVMIPLKKAKIFGGLIHDNTYGTQAFENGGEYWKLAGFMPIAKGIKIGLISKQINEESKNNNQGDSGATAIRLDTKFNNLSFGIKYVDGYQNKGDGKKVVGGQIDQQNTEKKAKMIDSYLLCTINNINIETEYLKQTVDLVGASKTLKPKGYYFSVGKNIYNLDAKVSYIYLSKGLKGGDDFDPGLILDGNINSNATKNTKALIFPFKYHINPQTIALLTYIKADILEKDAKEVDVGLNYMLDKNVDFGIKYGKFTQDNQPDKKKMELVCNIKF